jgi:hypothetical protein
MLTSEFEVSNTCVDTNTWRCTAPEWGSGSREFKSPRPDHHSAGNPSFPSGCGCAGLRRTTSMSAGSRPGSFLCAYWRGFPPSRSSTCVGSYRFSSNGRANCVRGHFAAGLGCVVRVRGDSSSELPERIRAVGSWVTVARPERQRRRGHPISLIARARVSGWSPAFSQWLPSRERHLEWRAQ